MSKSTQKTYDIAECGDGTFSFSLESNVESRIPKPTGSMWACVRTRSNKTAIVSHMDRGDGVQVDTIVSTWFYLGNTTGLNATGGASTVIDVVFYSQPPPRI